MTVDLKAAAIGGHACLLVTDDDGSERSVWLDLRRPARLWRCEEHGRQSTASCEHTFAAAVRIAEDFLGLTRIPELDDNNL